MSTILLTGGAGFIGSHLAETLLKTTEHRIVCIDNFDDFYPIALKKSNLASLLPQSRFQLIEADLASLEPTQLQQILAKKSIDKIIHLAAKAGVRPSIQDPYAYYRTNVTGTLNLLEFAREAGIPDFIFASSSSVYGNNPQVPWVESQPDLHPISPYASSKLAGEHLGQVYSHLYDIHFTALRLFTVYGPRQRPDLAIHKFYNQIKQGKEITLYGDGSTSRDYTYVGDLVKGIEAAVFHAPPEKFTTFNIGNGQPVSLLEMVRVLENAMGSKANIRFIEEQPGDVKRTWANIDMARNLLDYRPQTALSEGIHSFLQWKEAISIADY